MATSSCGGGSNGKYDPSTLHFQATPDRMQKLLAWYAKLATLASKTLPEKASTPPVIPPMLILTLVGCNTNPTKTDVTKWMKEAYTEASSFFAADTDKGAFDITCPLRVVISWDGTNLGFRFEDNLKRILNVVIFPEICPLAGIELTTYCVGFDQWKSYTDGACGQYYQQVKVNSQDCGYVPPIPAGEKLDTYCEGFDQWAFFSDGNYGKNPVKLHENSEDCGYVPPPAAGTVMGSKCKGVDKYDIVADGTGGTRDELNTPNSPECGFTPPIEPPTEGLIRTECRGTTKFGIYADGNGGTYDQVIANNSPDCGYVQPPVDNLRDIFVLPANSYLDPTNPGSWPVGTINNLIASADRSLYRLRAVRDDIGVITVYEVNRSLAIAISAMGSGGSDISFHWWIPNGSRSTGNALMLTFEPQSWRFLSSDPISAADWTHPDLCVVIGRSSGGDAGG